MLSERAFDALRVGYASSLHWVLGHRRATMAVFLGIVIATGFLFARMPKGFLPSDDSGQAILLHRSAAGHSFDAMAALQRQVAEIIRQDPNVEAAMSSIGATSFNPSLNVGRITIALKPHSERKSADEVLRGLRPKLANILGMKVFLQNVPAIRIGGQLTKSPYQYVVQSASTEELYHWAPLVEAKLKTVPSIVDVSSDLQISRPQSPWTSTARRPPRWASRRNRSRRRSAMPTAPNRFRLSTPRPTSTG